MKVVVPSRVGNPELVERRRAELVEADAHLFYAQGVSRHHRARHRCAHDVIMLAIGWAVKRWAVAPQFTPAACADETAALLLARLRPGAGPGDPRVTMNTSK